MVLKEKRIKELENLIVGYQASYYNGEAEISDSEFDLLWDELKELNPKSDVLKKVGTGPDVDGFPKARHLIPMGSQDKASNHQEFIKWAEKQIAKKNKKDITFLVQYKLDGASLELQYEKGKLNKAVTRGDGITGDEITANAIRMKGTVQKLGVPFTGGVRGEVIMTHNVWENKYPAKANCRNAANGIMRRKDGEGCEDLHLIVYDASALDDDNFFTDEMKKLEWLKKCGFETTETKIYNCIDDILNYRDEIAKKRDTLPFDIDGLVVKDIETDMTDLRKARPEKQIAFKFELETAFSILREVIWSESGATYTPIGVVDPVRLAGTTVKRANLNNPDMIRAMGLKLGSYVCVVKRGEIIPKIEGLAPVQSDEEIKEIEFPNKCGTCETDLVDAGTRLYCPNQDCPKRLLHRLEKWVSVLDIRELGEKLIKQLFENNIRHIHQLYDLKADELSEYDRMGKLSAEKVIRHIQTKRELSLASFAAGFDFEGIAETTMEKIAAAGFDTLEKLRNATVADLASVYGLGEITANVIAEGLKECKKEMDSVLNANIITIAPPPSEESQPLRGKSFCFTGELKTMKRGEAEEKIRLLGAQAKTSVVKGLSYLVTNDPSSGSSKNKKANDLGIPIIDEDGFLELIKTNQELKKETLQGELF
ncbi:MAG: NAD-dependent DNA ligase LigA [Treponema sp.]|nr:NAD-dependent DNA ligase LigA [Treponema sp.]MCL2236734.1 NAD-dependent DNA ligase LigA [Treponema sp.]